MSANVHGEKYSLLLIKADCTLTYPISRILKVKVYELSLARHVAYVVGVEWACFFHTNMPSYYSCVE